MFKSMLTIIVSGLLTGAALAQEAQQAQPPFTGVITTNDVYVRAGASQNYYPVGKLNTGDMVNVVELLYGWYGIQPPVGSFSFIAKQYVKLDADGVTGTITGDDVRVRAPSPAGPDQSYKIQLKLDTGAKVQVLGTEEDFYKIAPPTGALLYVHQDYMKQAASEQPAPAAPAPTAQTTAQAPAAEPATPPTTAATETAAPVAESAPAAEPAAEATSPATTEAAPAEAVPSEVASSEAVTLAPAPPQPRSYNSVGKLLTSTIYTGDEMPLLYRLVDQQSGLTIAYIQPPDPYIMLPLLGKFVGIVGDSRYDPGMKLPIIRAKEFDALGPAS